MQWEKVSAGKKKEKNRGSKRRSYVVMINKITFALFKTDIIQP